MPLYLDINLEYSHMYLLDLFSISLMIFYLACVAFSTV